MVALFRERSSAVLICAFLQFGGSIALGIYTATVVSRLQFLGVRAAGPWIALFGQYPIQCWLSRGGNGQLPFTQAQLKARITAKNHQRPSTAICQLQIVSISRLS